MPLPRSLRAWQPEEQQKIWYGYALLSFSAYYSTENPGPLFVDALRKTDNTIEAMIILNTIVLLKDFHDYQIEVTTDMFPAQWTSDEESNLNLRLDHLNN